MKTKPLIAAVVLTAASAATIALANPTLSSAANTSLNIAQEKASSFLQQMTKNLHESGLADVKFMPNSFLVQANDKSGNPVTMFITPNSMAEITIHKKSGNPETMFMTSKSMAVVPASG